MTKEARTPRPMSRVTETRRDESPNEESTYDVGTQLTANLCLPMRT